LINPKILFIILLFPIDDLLDRIREGHGFLITAIGLLAVFTGLLILWVITTALKYLIERVFQKKGLTNLKNQKVSEKELPDAITEEEIIAAITVALFFELEEPPSKLTLRHHEQDMSPWVVASRPATMRR
jgi:hypothetical protein